MINGLPQKSRRRSIRRRMTAAEPTLKSKLYSQAFVVYKFSEINLRISCSSPIRAFLGFFAAYPHPPLSLPLTTGCAPEASLCSGRGRVACSNRLLLFRSFSSVPDSSAGVTWLNKVLQTTYPCYFRCVPPARNCELQFSV